MKVTVYSAEWCHNCKGVKRALEGYGIGYTEVDVDNEKGAALARSKGISGLPYLELVSNKGRERSGVGTQMLSGLKEFLND